MQKTHLKPEQVWNHPILRLLIHKTDPENKYTDVRSYAANFAWIMYGAYEMELNGKIVYTIELDELKKSHFGMLNDIWRLSHDLKKKIAVVHTMSEEEWIKIY
jgi:hypothetical protein